MQRIFNYYKNLIYESRKWIYFTLMIFLLGFVWGVIISSTYSQLTRQIFGQYSSSLNLASKSNLETSIFIFNRNFSILATSTFGAFFFGVSAFVVTFANGLILGSIVSWPEIYKVINPLQLLLLLLPHGIFEYPALFLGLSFGLRLGLNWIFAKNQRRLSVFLKNLKETMAIFVLVSLLLVVAAFIEGFLTEIIACKLSFICR